MHYEKKINCSIEPTRIEKLKSNKKLIRTFISFIQRKDKKFLLSRNLPLHTTPPVLGIAQEWEALHNKIKLKCFLIMYFKTIMLYIKNEKKQNKKMFHYAAEMSLTFFDNSDACPPDGETRKSLLTPSFVPSFERAIFWSKKKTYQ